MAIIQFRDIDNFRIADTSEVIPAFSFSVSTKQQLSQVLVTTYIHGSTAGNEKIRAYLYSDSALTNLIDTSDHLHVSISENIAPNWYGQIGITFSNRPWIGLNNTFYVALTVADYTQLGNSYYISFRIKESYIENTLVTLKGRPD
jgi:hypothetical protein